VENPAPVGTGGTVDPDAGRLESAIPADQNFRSTFAVATYVNHSNGEQGNFGFTVLVLVAFVSP